MDNTEDIIDNNTENDTEEECVICLELLPILPILPILPSNAIETPCGHQFCRKCIAEWFHVKDECPICRKQGIRSNLFPEIQFPNAIDNSNETTALLYNYGDAIVPIPSDPGEVEEHERRRNQIKKFRLKVTFALVLIIFIIWQSRDNPDQQYFNGFKAVECNAIFPEVRVPYRCPTAKCTQEQIKKCVIGTGKMCQNCSIGNYCFSIGYIPVNFTSDLLNSSNSSVSVLIFGKPKPKNWKYLPGLIQKIDIIPGKKFNCHYNQKENKILYRAVSSGGIYFVVYALLMVIWALTRLCISPGRPTNPCYFIGTSIFIFYLIHIMISIYSSSSEYNECYSSYSQYECIY